MTMQNIELKQVSIQMSSTSESSEDEEAYWPESHPFITTETKGSQFYKPNEMPRTPILRQYSSVPMVSSTSPHGLLSHLNHGIEHADLIAGRPSKLRKNFGKF